MVAAIKSVAWPRSNRNRWPRCIGIRNVQHKVEFLQADGLKIAHSQDTRVDDNDVETTNLGNNLGDGVADRRWICAVCLDREAGSAFLLDRTYRVSAALSGADT